MTERAQIGKPGAPQRLGRRGDAAEAQVAHRLQAPGLQALHGGALDQLKRAGETAGGLPETVGPALAGAGQPLAAAVRTPMERAFGTGFGDVRLHTGPAADRAARDMGTAAFASGSDIGFATGAYRPDTAIGRGLIAHELAHASAARAGRDDPGVVRRADVAPAEVATALKDDSYSMAEMVSFLNGLENESSGGARMDYTMSSDNLARCIVNNGFHAKRGLHVRFRLIEHMMDGWVLAEDEAGIMQILREAAPMERETLVAKVGKDRLKDKIDDDALSAELSAMVEGTLDATGAPVGGTENSKRGTMPVTWRLDHNIRTDSVLSEGVSGLQVVNMQSRPSGGEAGPVAINEPVSGLQGFGKVVGQNVPHPKNRAGEASMLFWVVPDDPLMQQVYEAKTMTAVDMQPYPTVPATAGQMVTAQLKVDLAAAKIGEDKAGATDTRGLQQGAALTLGNSTTDTTGSVNRTGREKGVEAGIGTSAQAQVNAQATRGRSQTRSQSQEWSAEISRQVEVMKQFQASKEHSTTDETETSIKFGGTIHGQMDASLERRLKAAGSAGLKIADLGVGLISKLLGYLPIPQSKALAGILSLVDDVGVDLTLALEGEAAAGYKLSVGGTLSGEAARLWRHSETTTKGWTVTAGVTDTAAGKVAAGGSAGISDTANAEEQRGAMLQQGQSADLKATDKQIIENENSRQKAETTSAELQLSIQQSEEQARSREAMRDANVPSVKSATLTFRVEKDIWGAGRPTVVKAADAPQKEGG